MAYPFFTIGHSTRPVEEFVDLLERAQVACVVDVRSVPRSRTNPQYNGDMLPETLGQFNFDGRMMSEPGRAGLCNQLRIGQKLGSRA